LIHVKMVPMLLVATLLPPKFNFVGPLGHLIHSGSKLVNFIKVF
jgi:hypothetical protein